MKYRREKLSDRLAPASLSTPSKRDHSKFVDLFALCQLFGSQCLFALHVEIPSTAYKPHQLTTPVSSGTIPRKAQGDFGPQKASETMKSPKTILMSRSIPATFLVI